MYLEEDTYRVEDHEDKVPEGTIEEVPSDERVEEISVVRKSKKLVKEKDFPERVNVPGISWGSAISVQQVMDPLWCLLSGRSPSLSWQGKVALVFTMMAASSILEMNTRISPSTIMTLRHLDAR